MNNKYGASQYCPVCNGYNISGLKLPEECVWCNPYLLKTIMTIKEAIEIACEEPTLLDALSWICIWESERVVKQAKRGLRGPDGQGWDTCFKFCLNEVMIKYKTK